MQNEQDNTMMTTEQLAPPQYPQLETTINEWEIIDKIGEGAFGAVFKCKQAYENNNDKGIYAMKIENDNSNIQFIGLEAAVYTALQENQTRKGHQPTMFAQGRWQNYGYIVMTLVGPSLLELREERPDNKFSMGTSLVIARQTLQCLLELHNVGYLHRDIKPANFAIGLGADNSAIYGFDFGMARRFVKEGEDGSRVLRRPRTGKIGFRGTFKYASTHSHQGTELCRGDDIESWFYLVCELIKGKLPWSKYEDPQKIFNMKKSAKHPATREDGSTDQLARRLLLGGCPRQFEPMLDLIANIKYYDTPPYNQLFNWIGEAIEATSARTSPLDWQKDEAAMEQNLDNRPNEE